MYMALDPNVSVLELIMQTFYGIIINIYMYAFFILELQQGLQ